MRHPFLFGLFFQLLISLFIPAAYSQSVRFSFKVGVRLTDEVSKSHLSESFSDFQHDSDIVDESRPMALGPAIELRLPARMSVESGILYRSVAILGTTHTFVTGRDPSDPFRLNVRFPRRTHSKSISPEIRYTRWSRRVFDLPSFPAATKLDQVDLFLGIGL